jgi:hypothetical protein
VLALLSAGSLTNAQAACATGHIAAVLANFPPEAVSSPFYWATESEGQVIFVLRAVGDDCTPSAVTISYQTKDGTAVSGTDYLPNSGQRVVTTDPTHGGNDRQPVAVSVVNDPVPEAVIESATVELTGAQGGYLSAPTSAALHMIDEDGPTTRVSLDGAAVYRQLETFSGAGVPVFRGGPVNVTTTVNYTVEPGPAEAASPGQDFKATSGALTFVPGERVRMIPITLLNDRDTEPEENFTITLTGVEGGMLDGAATTRFTILDNEESNAPISLFHHPRNKWKYKARDYRIREIHVFTQDKGGAGVIKAEIALRQNMQGGRCAWLKGSKWKTRSCKKEIWNKMGKYETDFFFIRMPELPSTTGGIQSYTAFSRATDGAGNTERRFDPGRNENTFDIK